MAAICQSRRPGRLRDLLPWSAKLRYLSWRTGWLGHTTRIRLRTGERLILRRPPATDLQTAHEMFVGEAYAAPWSLSADEIRRIVDLGSNVGYSVVYLSARYPRAHVEAFEPHPLHARYLRQHIQMNGLAERVTVHEAAVSSRDGELWLTDRGTHSQLVASSDQPAVRVQVIDWLSAAQGQRIDLLKMDIEGAEFELIEDPRFADLEINYLVVEWHTSGDAGECEQRVCHRLESLGYRTLPSPLAGELPGLKFGLIWAARERP